MRSICDSSCSIIAAAATGRRAPLSDDLDPVIGRLCERLGPHPALIPTAELEWWVGRWQRRTGKSLDSTSWPLGTAFAELDQRLFMRGHPASVSRSLSLLASRPPSRLPALNLCITMGNDGGSIPDRRDLVRSKPKVRQHFARIGSCSSLASQAEQADKANQVRAAWFFCALSKVSSHFFTPSHYHLPTFPCRKPCENR